MQPVFGNAPAEAGNGNVLLLLPAQSRAAFRVRERIKAVLYVVAVSLGRIPWKLQVGQAHVVDHDLIGADIRGRLKIWHATRTA